MKHYKTSVNNREHALAYYYDHREAILKRLQEKRDAMTQEERDAHNAYKREWNAKNKWRVHEINRRCYMKRCGLLTKSE